ncbi:MAG TPA: hypothetical protein VII52_11710 [Gemmatimonadaceae bacterium]
MPDTLTVQQFAGAVKTSLNSPAWKHMFSDLAKGTELRKPSQRPALSPEALAFVTELLGSSAASVTGSMSAPPPKMASPATAATARTPTTSHSGAQIRSGQRPSFMGACFTTDAECECDYETIAYDYYDVTYYSSAWVCVQISGGGEDWSIDLSFFISETDLTADDYAYLLNYGELGAPTYACSGTSTPNEVDNLINQYVTDATAATPSCSSFTYQPAGFPGWAYVQSHDVAPNAVPNYAIYMRDLDDNLRQLHTDTLYSVSSISRIYTTPSHNDALGTVKNSQHIYGSAADIGVPDTLHWASLHNWGLYLIPVPCSEPWTIVQARNHVHFDYRTDADAIYNPGCPFAWQLRPL